MLNEKVNTQLSNLQKQIDAVSKASGGRTASQKAQIKEVAGALTEMINIERTAIQKGVTNARIKEYENLQRTVAKYDQSVRDAAENEKNVLKAKSRLQDEINASTAKAEQAENKRIQEKLKAAELEAKAEEKLAAQEQARKAKEEAEYQKVADEANKELAAKRERERQAEQRYMEEQRKIREKAAQEQAALEKEQLERSAKLQRANREAELRETFQYQEDL